MYLLHVIHSATNSEKNSDDTSVIYIKPAKVQFARQTTFISLVSNTCWSSVRSTVYVTLLAPYTSRRVIDVCKICALLNSTTFKTPLKPLNIYSPPLYKVTRSSKLYLAGTCVVYPRMRLSVLSLITPSYFLLMQASHTI
jgi:hypothetical protein